MKRLARFGVAASVLLAAAGLTACGPRQPWQNELVSVNADGTDSGNGASRGQVFSPDGTKVAFFSAASDLGPTDTNGTSDLYVRDLEAGTTILASVNAVGSDSGNGASWDDVVFSPDGTKIAFISEASDLGPTDTNGRIDVYVRDLEAGTTTLVSANRNGLDSGNGQSRYPAFSPDGTKIAFVSTADDLGPTDTNRGEDVYLRDLVAGTTTLVSASSDGTNSGNSWSGWSRAPVFSPDGVKVAFVSDATDLGPTDTDRVGSFANGLDVYVRDLGSQTTSLVSVNAAGTDSGNSLSNDPVFGPDSTKIAFVSRAADLGPTDTNVQEDVYLRDMVAGTTTLVSASTEGTADGSTPADPVFSPDGTKIAFASGGDELGPIDTNSLPDVYVRDLVAGTTTLVSANAAGTDAGNADSWGPDFSPDGTKVAFTSQADDLGPTDTARTWYQQDVYVRDLVSRTTTLVSARADGLDSGDAESYVSPEFSPDGRRVLFSSKASNLGPTDSGRPGEWTDQGDVYIATLRGADLAMEGVVDTPSVQPGSYAQYRFTVTNDGPDAAEDVAMSLVLPERTTYDVAFPSGPSGGTCHWAPATPRLVVCELGDLPVDGAGTVLLRVGVPGDVPAGTPLTALAVAGSEPTADPVHNNNAVTVTSTVSGQ